MWTQLWTFRWTSTALAAAMTIIESPSSGASERLVYTVAEAGELLGISRAFAYELVARGELPVIRLGRRRLVPKVALLAFIAQGTDEPDGSRW